MVSVGRGREAAFDALLLTSDRQTAPMSGLMFVLISLALPKKRGL